MEPFSTDENDDVDGTGMGRDVFNEKPRKEDIITAVEVSVIANRIKIFIAVFIHLFVSLQKFILRQNVEISDFQSDIIDSKVTEYAVIHTSFGDIHIKLFPNECPKAVENFCTHARRGYYNGHTFHRVIKSFMIQVIFDISFLILCFD